MKRSVLEKVFKVWIHKCKNEFFVRLFSFVRSIFGKAINRPSLKQINYCCGSSDRYFMVRRGLLYWLSLKTFSYYSLTLRSFWLISYSDDIASCIERLCLVDMVFYKLIDANLSVCFFCLVIINKNSLIGWINENLLQTNLIKLQTKN